MRVLVTGHTGHLGSHLVPKLLLLGHHVIGVGRHSLPSSDGIDFVRIDLSSPWSIRELPQEVDAIIHLAQSRHYRNFPLRARDVFEVNISSTALLLDYARQASCQKFVLASTGGLYPRGAVPSSEITFPDALQRLDYYLSSKLSAEALSTSYSTEFEVNILRYFFLYGRRQSSEMLIPRLVAMVLNNQEIPIVGETGIRITPTHVSDAAQATANILKIRGSEVFNICGSEALSIVEICKQIGEVAGVKPRFRVGPGTDQDCLGDNAKMVRKIHHPAITFRQGVEDMLRQEHAE